MPDLSADRPLPLPEKIFSEEDVEAAVQRLIEGAWEGDGGAGTRDDLAEIARVVLTSAAARGRLLPSSAEHREEWGVVWRSERGGVVLTEDAFLGRLEAGVHGRRRVGRYDVASFTVRRREHRMFDDGSTLTGPWIQVEGSTTDA